jgi:hypothetical protein
MTHTPLAVKAVAFTCMLAYDARGDETRWDPGNRTTSTVDGEVTTPEPGQVSDGVYGRFEGDLDLGVGLGADVGQNVLYAARLSLHYFSMAGFSVGYADAFGEPTETGDARRLTVGVDLRPAFVPRWAKDMEQGPALVDLAVDSISLGLGAFWAEPRGAEFGDVRGFELSLGFGLPLFARASGLWLDARGVLRWPEAQDVEPAALLLLSYHALFESPITRTSE